MNSHLNSKTAPQAGSNAGRGFRYQDLVGALFVTRMYLGEAGFNVIIPEGSDDYEIRNVDGIILVDTKSTRATARLRCESDDVASLQKLWVRPVMRGAQISEYWLVTERSRDNRLVTQKLPAQGLFCGDAPVKSGISFVLVEPHPLQKAIELLAVQRGITPLAAELVVLAFARVVGELASANGPLDIEIRKGLTSNDAERIAARVLGAVDADRLEALLRSGFVSVIDFDTPLHDAGFYLGVDVQPGHFAAGLALERPDEAAHIVEALNRNGAAVIRGPSGAGKSSLMWNAVLAARGARRWFRVNASVSTEPDEIIAFLEAYKSAAIGFVIDDIGRGGVEVWSSLRLCCHTHAQAVMIGSIRSEDAALLPARHTIVEIDTSVDSQLARALWVKLRERGQTKWPGWSEPWGQSQGLLLEYGHLLTAGMRLASVILDQICTRLKQKRDHELAILGASALAAAHGGSVPIETLRHQLSLSKGDIARALERLIAEHLIRVDATGAKLSGLHSLRAASVSSALAKVGYSTLAEQAKMAIAVTDVASLEKVIAGTVASGVISDEAAAEAAAARLVGNIILSEVVAAVRGLRAGVLTLTTRQWLTTLPAAGVPRKLATAAALMGLTAPASMPDIGEMRNLVAYGNRLHSSVATQRFPASLASVLIAAMRSSADRASVTDSVDAISALARAPLTAEQRTDLAVLPLRFDDLSIADVVRILDAAESIDPAISSAWIERTEQSNLLERLSAETPFALPLTREVIDDGCVVHGAIYEAAVRPGESPNDGLVAHVHSIMRLEPSASLAHVRLVDMNAVTSVHIDSEKLMPRENAPPRALAESNRRVLDAVAVEVASESWSHYLKLGEQLLKRALRALQRLLDSMTVGRVNEQALATLNEVIAACDDLIAPVDPPMGGAENIPPLSGRHLTPMQNLIFSSSARLVVRVAQLPDGAATLAAYVEDLIKQGDDAKQEPWLLVRDDAPEELDQLQHTLRQIEFVALEAAASGENPRHRWRMSGGKPRNAFNVIANHSQNAFIQRIEARRATLSEIVIRELPGAVLCGPTLADGIMWRTRFVATFPITASSDFKRWIGDAREIGERLRLQAQEEEDMVLVPLLNGHAAIDYAYQLSRGNQYSIVAPMLIAAGHTSLLLPPDQSVLDRLDSPVIRHPSQLELVFTALRDLSGMHQLGLGGLGRPAAECARFELAISDLVTNGPRLLEIIGGIENPAIDALKAVINFFLHDSENELIPPLVFYDDFQDALAEITWRRCQTLD